MIVNRQTLANLFIIMRNMKNHNGKNCHSALHLTVKTDMAK